MAQVAFSGMLPIWRGPLMWEGPASVTPATTLLLDAAGEMVAFMGRVWFAARTGTKSIRKVHYLTGAVTAGSGTTFRVSLQNMSTTANIQPDEVVDENWTTTAMPSANTWSSTGNLSLDRSVSFGELLAVVFDFETFGASTSIVISGLPNEPQNASFPFGPASRLKTGGAWGATTMAPIPNVLLEFSDGTFGTLYGAAVFSAFNTESFNSGTTAGAGGDERGIEFVPEVPFTSDGCTFLGAIASNAADFEVKLYEDGVALETVSIDANTIAYNTSQPRPLVVAWSQSRAFATSKTYNITLRPTTVNNVSLYTFSLSVAGHRVAHYGTAAGYNVKTDAGAFGAIDTTKVPMIWPMACGADNGAGGGGGLMTHPGMSGGMRG